MVVAIILETSVPVDGLMDRRQCSCHVRRPARWMFDLKLMKSTKTTIKENLRHRSYFNPVVFTMMYRVPERHLSHVDFTRAQLGVLAGIITLTVDQINPVKIFLHVFPAVAPWHIVSVCVLLFTLVLVLPGVVVVACEGRLYLRGGLLGIKQLWRDFSMIIQNTIE